MVLKRVKLIYWKIFFLDIFICQLDKTDGSVQKCSARRGSTEPKSLVRSGPARLVISVWIAPIRRDMNILDFEFVYWLNICCLLAYYFAKCNNKSHYFLALPGFQCYSFSLYNLLSRLTRFSWLMKWKYILMPVQMVRILGSSHPGAHLHAIYIFLDYSMFYN